MASDESFMECIFEIDTSDGWEVSVTKVFASFEDLTYVIDPAMGCIYVKGKADPKLILKQLKKGSKHAKILSIKYGPDPKDHDKKQQQHNDLKSGQNNNNNNQQQQQHQQYHGQYGPSSNARDPYEILAYYQLTHPPYNNYWSDNDHMAQNALHYGQQQQQQQPPLVGDGEPNGHSSERRRSSGHSHHPECPLHNSHHYSSSVSSSWHRRTSPVPDSSPQSMQSEANDQAINQPASNKPSPARRFIKKVIEKVIGKFHSSCLWLCSKM